MPSLLYKFGNEEHRFDLGERTAIGRLKDNDLCIPSQSMSSHHALITREGETFQLSDQGSSNGIIVNNCRVASLALQDRAAFSLGDVDFVFVAGDGVSVSTAAGAPSLPAPQAAAAPAPDRPEEVIARFK